KEDFQISEGVFEIIFQNEGDAPIRISNKGLSGGGHLLQQRQNAAGGEFVYEKVSFRAPDSAHFGGAFYEIKFETVRPGVLNIIELSYAN
ncbi:MAG: hypothetical protein AAFR66_02175, partial [Bacteroidota bacterium]